METLRMVLSPALGEESYDQKYIQRLKLLYQFHKTYPDLTQEFMEVIQYLSQSGIDF